MINGPLPDLAFSIRQQAQIRDLRQAMSDAGSELTTGQIADLRDLAAGGISRVFAIDNARTGIEAARLSLDSSASRATAAQAAMEKLNTLLGTSGIDLRSALDIGDVISVRSYTREAEPALVDVISTLNTRQGGQALFAGAALDANALGSADDLIADLRTLISPVTDAATAIGLIDAYFDDPAGPFQTGFYGGDAQQATGPVLSDGTRIDFLPRASDPELREIIRSLAMVTIADADGAGWPAQAQTEFLYESADRLARVGDGLLSVRAELGQSEERLKQAKDSADAEAAALVLARNDITAVDPFVAATRFADLEGQIQSAYTVTARLSSLTLTNFLR